jgi:hypothetical protein
VFLTLVGGGAFGNESEWIMEAIKRSLKIYKAWDLDVAIVSYRKSNPALQALAEEFSQK